MRDFFRETTAGQLIRIASRGRYLGYDDTRNLEAVSASTPEGELKFDLENADIIVGWNGTKDPDDPQNWSLSKKIYVTCLINLLTFSIYIGSAIYTAGTQSIMEQFGVSEVVATLGLSLFVLGYAAGPMFWAPLSETPPFGRTTVYMSTLLCFILLNFGVVYASNIGMLLAFRFLTAFFGSPVLATGGASLADLYAPQKRAYAIGIWGLFAVAGPTMGPLVGGFAVQARDWTWSIWELIWLATFTFVLLLFTLPETSPQNILFRRAYRLRKFTGNHAFKTEADVIAASQSVRKMMLESLSRPFTLCFTEPILVATNGYLGLVYAILYTWFEAFPLVFADIYHFNLGESGLAYLGLLIGAVGVTLPYCYWLWRYQEPLFDEDGNIAPEKRLPPAVIGSAMIPVCLFWFGWSSREDVHWIMPIIGSAFFPMGAVLLFNTILLYQGDTYPQYVGSVLAGNDLVRGAFGAGFPLFATAMFKTLGIQWGCSLLGFLSITFAPIPVFLLVYGKRIRMKSKHARHDI